MSARKKLPPKGAEQVVEAVQAVDEAARVRRISNRYDATTPPAALDWSPSGSGTSAVVQPPPPQEPAPPRRAARQPRERRQEPEGMTRKTLYLPKEAADALDDAVRHVQKAVGGRVEKHAILGALIAAGAAEQDRIADAIRTALLRELGA